MIPKSGGRVYDRPRSSADVFREAYRRWDRTASRGQVNNAYEAARALAKLLDADERPMEQKIAECLDVQVERLTIPRIAAEAIRLEDALVEAKSGIVALQRHLLRLAPDQPPGVPNHKVRSWVCLCGNFRTRANDHGAKNQWRAHVHDIMGLYPS